MSGMERKSETRITALTLTAIAFGMVGLAFAAVPFYDWFCRVTGFGGTTAVAETGSDVILDRTMKVQFDGSLAAGMEWEFHAETKQAEVRIGETNIAFYRATNKTDRPIAGTASFNVTPFSAGGYFVKIDCFCFTEQVLQPGESVLMPVTYYIDPEIVDDREAKHLHTITLSYTFFETELPMTEARAPVTDSAGTSPAASGIN